MMKTMTINTWIPFKYYKTIILHVEGLLIMMMITNASKLMDYLRITIKMSSTSCETDKACRALAHPKFEHASSIWAKSDDLELAQNRV